VLKFLKPAAALAVVICETAKTVSGNADAAKELSENTTEILHLVVDHLRQVPLTEISPDLERDAVKLYQTLEKVNQHLTKLKKRKRKVYALLWAQKDKEYFNELKNQLDEVLITFGVSRTLAVNREVARVQGIVHETNQDVKLMLSRLENTSCLRRLDEPRVIHGDNVCRESALSKYLEYIPESSSGDGKTVTVIRLYKATYHGLHGDVLPIIALDYSGIAETDFVKMCHLHRSNRNPYLAQVYGSSSSQHTLYFFSSLNCLSMDQVMEQASEDEALRRLSQLNEAVTDIAAYLWKEPVPLLISPQTCVIQGDKVVLMDIPSPIHNHRDRVDKERVLTDVEVSLGDNRKQKFEIETIYSHGSPHDTHV